MGKTSIEWTDASWNPIVGCTEVSPGCANCYAARLAATRLREVRAYRGLASGEIQRVGGFRFERRSIHWTGEVRFLPERLEEPLYWKTPRRIFVCDMGDLFHGNVHGDWIDQVLSIIQRCQQHTFQILTKRASRMHYEFIRHYQFVKKNVWLGVSVENQQFADERIPLLLDTPAAVRFISAEPLLGAVDLNKYLYRCCGAIMDDREDEWLRCCRHTGKDRHDKLDWVICGGESGPNARPMHPEWARSMRDQCQAVRVPFFFKQWGEWVDPEQNVCALHSSGEHGYVVDTRKHSEGCLNKTRFVLKVGKKKAGRMLDGREWNELPKGNNP